MMTILYLSLLICFNYFVAKRARNIFNPQFFLSLFFHVPLVLSSLKLTAVEGDIWLFETKVMLSGAFLIFCLPGIFVLLFRKESGHPIVVRKHRLANGYTSLRLIVFGLIASYLLENFILSGNILPFLTGSDQLHKLHTASIPGLSIVSRSISLGCLLSFYMFMEKRKLIDLGLLILTLIIPLTKGSRMELFISILVVVIFYFSINQPSFKRLLITSGIGVSIVIVMGFIGQMRSSQLGEIKWSYANIIGYNGNPGPYDSFAFAYSYFVLNFDNLDRLIRNTPNTRYHGLLSLMPLTDSVFEFDRVFNKPGIEILKNHRKPNTKNGVSTALAAFYLDFGPVGGLISLSMYMLFLIYLYAIRHGSLRNLILYCFMLTFFCLSAFQPVILAPISYRILLGTLLFFTFFAQTQISFNKKLNPVQ